METATSNDLSRQEKERIQYILWLVAYNLIDDIRIVTQEGYDYISLWKRYIVSEDMN